MRSEGLAEEAVMLWRPAGQAELDLVAASGWRAWPPRLPGQPIFYPVLNRWYATKITREWNVPREGAGYVTRFGVRRGYLGRYTVQQAGGRDVLEYWIRAEDLEEFNAHITGAITEEARYLGPVSDLEFTRAAHALGQSLPAAWRDYLTGSSWFSRGWLPNGCYLSLFTPDESADAAGAWSPAAAKFPGLVILGSDGSRDMLAVDARRDPAPVVLIDISSAGWQDAVPQADNAAQFIEQLEAGTFEFTW